MFILYNLMPFFSIDRVVSGGVVEWWSGGVVEW
jgi:hypothetical protein